VKVTLVGTVATDGLEEIRLTVTPAAGAADDRTRFGLVDPGNAEMVALFGWKLIVVVVGEVTVTVSESPLTVGPFAVILAAPTLTPVICGCEAAATVVAPWGMVTVVGEMVSLVVSVLNRVIVWPPDTAGAEMLTG